MRLLANENFPRPLIGALRARGHDVADVKETTPGAEDAAVLHRAQAERRILVTFDKDFGELAFSTRLPAECGVILFRLSGSNPAADNARALFAIETRGDWSGLFSVVTDRKIRMRPLPPAPRAPGNP